MVSSKRVNNKIGFIGKRRPSGNGNILDNLRTWTNIMEKLSALYHVYLKCHNVEAQIRNYILFHNNSMKKFMMRLTMYKKNLNFGARMEEC